MFPGLTVRENFRLAALGSRAPKAEQQAAQRRALEVFPLLEQHLDRDASRLSGGQQQMVAVGRALIGGTKLLLVDEVTQGLAPNIAYDMGRTLRRVADEGHGVLLVEQNAQMALEVADRVYVVDQGVIVHSGDAEQLRERPRLDGRAPPALIPDEGARCMAELGVALLTFAPVRTQDFVSLGRCAEEQGYAACYTTESLTDTLSIDLAILLGTSTHPRGQLRHRSATCGTRSSRRRWRRPPPTCRAAGSCSESGSVTRSASRRSACPWASRRSTCRPTSGT